MGRENERVREGLYGRLNNYYYCLEILLRSGSHFYQCAVKRCQKVFLFFSNLQNLLLFLILERTKKVFVRNVIPYM